MTGGELDVRPLLPQRGQIKVDLTAYNIAILLVAIAIPLAGSFLLSAFTGGGDKNEWYKHLIKPSWTPPGWVFPVMWTFLYILMGIASFLVWKEGGFHAQAYPLALYVLQLLLNFSWTPLFFGLNRTDISLGIIIILWVTIAFTIFFFFQANHVAGYLLIPYILWVTVATALNGYIWKHNPLERNSGDLTTPLTTAGHPGTPTA